MFTHQIIKWIYEKNNGAYRMIISFVGKDKKSLSNHDGITYEWVASLDISTKVLSL